MTTFAVVLCGGSPWGFRITGGREFDEPITVSKINPNSKACNEGVKVGDVVTEINGQTTRGLSYADAQQVIKNATQQLLLRIDRGEKGPNVHLNGAVPASTAPRPHKVDTGVEAEKPKYKRAISIPELSPPSSSPSHRKGSASESRWSERGPFEQRGVTSPDMWSKRPTMPTASPKPQRHSIKPLALFQTQPASGFGNQTQPASGFGIQTQPISGFGTQGSRPSPQSQSHHTWGRGAGVGGGSVSPQGGANARGMNLFRRQQEKLAQLGADVQEISVNQGGYAPRPYEPPQAYSAQSSPGGVGPFARSLSVDEGRNVPIIVQTSAPRPFRPQPHRPRRNSENADSFYHVRAAHEQAPEPQQTHFPPWSQPPQEPSHGGRNFAVGSYATLPAKSSSSSSQQQQQAPRLHPHHQQQQQQPPPATSSGGGGSAVPVSQPLSVDADQPINDFDYHIYSTLPTIKPLRSTGRRGPLDLPELEREKKFQDFSKPLWTNTEPSHPSGDDSHSDNENAVSSSDSRDTIIARSDDTRSSHTDSTTKEKRSEPKMIPVRVVHEDGGRSHRANRSPAEFESMEQPWGKRVVEGAADSFTHAPSEPFTSSHEKPPDYQVNGLKSPSFTSSKRGVWSPGVGALSPSSVKSEPVGKSFDASSPPESSLKNIPAVWKPGGSGGGAKKEFRPVRLNTNAKPAERKASQDSLPKPEESYAWQPRRTSSTSDSLDGTHLPTASLKYTPMTTATTTLVSPDTKPAMSRAGSRGQRMGDHSGTNGSGGDGVFHGHKDDGEIHLPSTQSPYITLLQKSRENETQGDLNFNHIGSKKPIMVSSEGHIPRGAQYLGEKVTVDGNQQHTDTFYSMPTEEKTITTKTVEHKPVVYEGIGPVDTEGVPLAFRKNVTEENQHDWYKQMYKSLHRTDKKEDRLGINDMIDSIFEKAVNDLSKLEENKYRPTYKFPDDISDTKSEEDFNPYRPSYERTVKSKADDSGYRSEPEGRHTKDLFRRHRSTSEREPREPRRNFSSGYWAPASVRSKIDVYRVQPRSIVDYEPGFSSIAFQETKTRPRSYSAHSLRERKRKKQGNQFNPPIDKPGELSQYSVGGARHPSGHDERQEGDGADPREQYKKVQSGGDIPAKGLQKPAPDKPRATEPPIPPLPLSSLAPPPSSNTLPRTPHSARQPQPDKGGSTPTPRTPKGSAISAPAPPTRGGHGGVRGSATLPHPKRSSPYTTGLSAAQQLGVKSPPLSAAGTGSPGGFGGSNLVPSARVFKHQTTDAQRQKPQTGVVDPERERRRRQEEEAYRKKRLEELYEEERQKKMERDKMDTEARRHHDYFMNAQRSPISPNRFDDSPNMGSPGIGSSPLSPAIGSSPLSPSQPGSLGTLERKDQLSVPPERRRGFQLQGKARALYNFNAQNPRELSFRKNDIIYLHRQVDKNWFEGERHGRLGIFPSNYVEVVTSIEAARAAAMQAEGQGRARYNFTAQSTVELSLRKGEFVVLLRHVDDNWYEGRIGNRQGIFPISYVEVTRQPSTPLITPAPSVITTPMTGTPEMLSPVGYDAAPTPPPQPSPSALAAHRSPSGPYGYRQQGPGGHFFPTDPGSGSGSGSAPLLAPAPSVSRQQINLSRTEPDFSNPRSPVSSARSPTKSPISPGARLGSPLQGKRASPGPTPSFGPAPSLSVDIHSKAKPYTNGQARPGKVADDDLAVTRYRAVYAYRPQNEDELELREGDEIFVMEKCDDGWYVGTSNRTGSFGTFPGNYVQKI
ncbi:hypothetical protein V1264_010918 [Littorina saxatilis]|uniref:Sorbin and SH3 domain-containing protein 1 n=1 Tax=Littorina saxatilis TaxID=31220 RepID=A0AAN9BU79_9CAEN